MDNNYFINKLKENMEKEGKHTLVFKIFTLDDAIDDLELSSRSYNCIKRNKCSTVQELLDCTDNLRKLNVMRNCGTKSIKEIRNKIFIHQLNNLDDSGKERYINECVNLSY